MREMRRRQQALTEEETLKIIIEGSYGVLGVTGEMGYPYTVPMNYAYVGGKLLFHCACEGHKLDALRQNNKASFCVVAKSRVVKSKFATDYRSAIAFGQVRFVTEREEKQEALWHLVEKYAEDYRAEGQKEIETFLSRVCILELTVEHVTGKAAIQSVQECEEK